MTSFLALWAPVCISVECLIPRGKYFFIIFDYIGFESLPLPPVKPTSGSGHSTSEWLLDRFWLGRGIETRFLTFIFFLHPRRLNFASDVPLRIRNRVLTLSAWSFFVFRHGSYTSFTFLPNLTGPSHDPTPTRA